MSRGPVRRIQEHAGGPVPGLVLAGVLAAGLFCGCRSAGDRVSTRPDARGLAEAATRRGDWPAAAAHWHSVFLREQGATVEPIARTAEALLHTGDPAGARELAVLGLELHPRDPWLLELCGGAPAALGHRRAAESSYEDSVYNDPTRVSALVSLARLRVELGLERGAMGPLERALAVDPRHPAALSLLGRAAMTCGQYGRSYETFLRRFEAAEPSFEDLMCAASLWAYDDVRERYAEAPEVCLDWLERAAAIDPQSTLAHFEIGVISEDMGNDERALEAYRRSVEVDPTCLFALTNLACLYARLGDEAGVTEMVDRAVTLEPDASRRAALHALLDKVRKKAGEGAGDKVDEDEPDEPDDAQAGR